MAKFRLVEKQPTYYVCWIDAEDRDEALRIYREEHDKLDGLWKDDELGESELVSADQYDETCQTLIQANDVENGEFVD